MKLISKVQKCSCHGLKWETKAYMFKDISEINLGQIHIERFCKIYSFRDENDGPLTTFCPY